MGADMDTDMDTAIDSDLGRFRVIHCILPSGRGFDLLRQLKAEKGIVSAFAHHARGGGISTRKGRESFYYVEKEVVTVLAPEDRADEIFEFIFYASGVNQPHAGMVLMEKASVGASLTLPEGLPEED